MTEPSQADLLAEIETLRRELREARQRHDIAEAAIAYYDAGPNGTDEVVQCWYELKGAIEHWRAMQQVDHG